MKGQKKVVLESAKFNVVDQTLNVADYWNQDKNEEEQSKRRDKA